jgi:hypothetical protein
VTVLVADMGDIEEGLAWSPGGESLVFSLATDTGDFSQLCAYRFDDGVVSVLTSSSYDHSQPQFVSETEIVFRLDDPDGPSQIAKLYQYEDETGNEVTIVRRETTLTTSQFEHSAPFPAESAGFVLFEVENSDGYTMIGRVSIDGDSEVVLTSGDYDFETPTVEPQGESAFCIRVSGPASAVCALDPEAGGYELLTDDEADRESPHARPNQGSPTSAVYVREDGVYRTLGQGEEGGQGGVLGVIALDRIAPNPNRGKVRIQWQVPRLASVSLKVYDPSGRLVSTLHSGETKPGRYVTVWNGMDAKGRKQAAGVYFCTLDNGNKRIGRKLVLTD